ncbi:MAG: AEC family transporter [Bacteroidales bacterium]|jgi:predicted permease|nr:AEC family transporter [Bacteroidales bacterium]
MQNNIILYQIAVLAILVLVGIIATKLKVITEGSKKGIADLVFDVTLPLLIITTFARIDISPAILKNSGLVFLFAYIALGVMYLVGDVFSRVMKLKGNQRAVFINHHMFGNIVFLGFPLMDALFPGGEGLLYAAVFQLASNSVMWTFGVWVFLKGKGGTKKEVLKNMINPNTVAFFIGLLLMFFPINIPDIIFEPLHGLGKATIYLSMLYIGAMLVQTKVRGILKKPLVFVLSFNKLLLIPFILAIIVNLLSYWLFPGFGEIARKVVLLESSMPCMATIVVMAHKFGSDDELATENVFISTIFSMLTIPLVYSGLLLIDQFFAGLFV